MDKGANITDFSVENGYGVPSDKAMSKGEASYVSSPAKPMIENDNFTEPRFAGQSTPPSLGEQSTTGKDAIKTGDKNDTPLDSF